MRFGTVQIDWSRVGAVVRKEVRDYRRNRFILATMIVMPVIFMLNPVITIFSTPAAGSTAHVDTRVGLALLFLLLVPAVLPATIASSAVVTEREQGTLEPVLTTPVRREELLIGKAVAAMIPAVTIAYLMYGIFLGCVNAFANPVVASSVAEGPRILAQVLFTPLLAAWAIWAGLAVSVRANDVRVAQQLSFLASLPPLAVTALMSFNVIKPTFPVALAFALGLLAIDVMGWRVISPMFDRERLVTGAKSLRGGAGSERAIPPSRS